MISVGFLGDSRQVMKHFIHCSREIRPVSSLYRPATDGLMKQEAACIICLSAMSHCHVTVLQKYM